MTSDPFMKALRVIDAEDRVTKLRIDHEWASQHARDGRKHANWDLRAWLATTIKSIEKIGWRIRPNQRLDRNKDNCREDLFDHTIDIERLKPGDNYHVCARGSVSIKPIVHSKGQTSGKVDDWSYTVYGAIKLTVDTPNTCPVHPVADRVSMSKGWGSKTPTQWSGEFAVAFSRMLGTLDEILGTKDGAPRCSPARKNPAS